MLLLSQKSHWYLALEGRNEGITFQSFESSSSFRALQTSHNVCASKAFVDRAMRD